MTRNFSAARPTLRVAAGAVIALSMALAPQDTQAGALRYSAHSDDAQSGFRAVFARASGRISSVEETTEQASSGEPTKVLVYYETPQATDIPRLCQVSAVRVTPDTNAQDAGQVVAPSYRTMRLFGYLNAKADASACGRFASLTLFESSSSGAAEATRKIVEQIRSGAELQIAFKVGCREDGLLNNPRCTIPEWLSTLSLERVARSSEPMPLGAATYTQRIDLISDNSVEMRTVYIVYSYHGQSMELRVVRASELKVMSHRR